MVQNHMLQVLALTAMEPPAAFSAEAMRNEKVKALQAIRALEPAAIDTSTLRGQYAGYQAAAGVAAGSTTETYVALRLQIGLKPPGAAMELRPVALDFRYAAGFEAPTPEAYERLLLDALLGDATLFIRRDEVEAAWAFITPILERRAEADAPPPASYAQGNLGPEATDALLTREGRQWRRP